MAFLMKCDDDIEFLRELRDTPVGRQVSSKLTDAKTAARAASIARLATVRADAATERSGFERAFSAAQAAVKQAEEVLKGAIMSARQVLSEHDSARFLADAEIQKLENELSQSAPAAINDFIKWATDEHHKTLNIPILSESVVTDQTDKDTLRKIVLLKTNSKAIAARAKALLDAKAEALALAVSIADPNEISDRVRELRNGIPLI